MLPSVDILGTLTMVGSWVMLWLITSIAVYLAARAVTGGEATFKAALAITSVGVLIVFLVLTLVVSFLGTTTSFSMGLLVTFFVWLSLIKISFRTGWLRALAIAILATIILAGIVHVLSLLVVSSLFNSVFQPGLCVCGLASTGRVSYYSA